MTTKTLHCRASRAVLRLLAVAGAAWAVSGMLCLRARAESGAGWLDQAGFGGFADYARNASGFDAPAFLQALLTGGELGGVESLKALMDSLIGQVAGAFTALLRRLAGPVALCAGLRLIVGREKAAVGMANLVCGLCCAVALAECFADARATAEAFLDAMVRATEVMTPVLCAAGALTGAASASAMLQPLSTELAAIAAYVLRGVALPLCASAGAVAVAGSLSPRFSLSRLFDLLGSVVRWLLGAAALLFGGLVTARTAMGGARDSAALRAAKTAIEALVPVIGGGVSDSAGALAVSAGALRRAVGITGAAFVVHACAAPLAKIAAAMASVKLAAAALEPISEGPAAAMAGRFGDLMALLLAICLTCAVMTALLTGGCTLLTGL